MKGQISRELQSNAHSTILLTLTAIFVVSCGEERVICPRCDESLTWDSIQERHSAYGQMNTGSSRGDSYAWKMLDECRGWTIYRDHRGGTGDTLEIANCSGGLILRWAWSSFESVRLSAGWTGSMTVTNLAFGARYEDWINAYPCSNKFTSIDGRRTYLEYHNGSARFLNGVLSELIVR